MPQTQTDSNNLAWFSKPQPGHLVEFYQSKTHLIQQLSLFIGTGIKQDNNGVIIATPEHIQRLHMELTEQEVKIPAVLKNGSYVIMDAAETLGQFMVDGLPDKERFYNVIGTLIEKLAHNGKPIRAYGEMVALLWKTGNKEAVIQLEQLWNELAEKYKFSLFCAYPALHFIMDKDMAEDIRQCHNVNLPVFS